MATLLENLRRFVYGAKPTTAPTVAKPFLRRITVQCTVSIPANTPANASTNVSFTVDPKVGPVTSYTIPKGQIWNLIDAYIKASGDVGADGITKLKLNFFKDHVILPPLSTMLVSNPSRPQISPKAWNEGDTISGEFINTVSVGASAVTNTFYLVFDIYGYE
jgi:hypothetical protein